MIIAVHKIKGVIRTYTIDVHIIMDLLHIIHVHI